MATSKKKPAPPPNARKNRDQESLYRPGQLSKWFAVTSLILVIGWVMMLWKDYDRPWKDYQQRFYDTLISVEETATIDDRTASQTNEDLKAAEDALKAVENKYNREGTFAKLAEMRQELHDLQKDAIAADNRFKSVKGDHSVAKYEFEMARLNRDELQRKKDAGTTGLDGDIEKANKETEARRDELNALADQWYVTKNDAETLSRRVVALRREIRDTESELTEARGVYADARADLTKQENKFEGINQKFGKNKWRNAPFVDFISPSIKIDQILPKGIHDNWNFATAQKVDRCTTCHQGMAMPTFADPAIVDNEKYGVENYMKAHPHLEMILGPNSPHPIGQIGCTVCHHGVGWAVDFARCAHTPLDEEQREQWAEDHGWYKAKYIDYPMIPVEYTQGMCHKCHKQGMFEPVHYEEKLDHGFVADELDRGIFAQRAITNDPTDPAFDSPENYVLGPGQVSGDWKLPDAPEPVDGSMYQVAMATRDFLRDHYGEETGFYHDDRAPSWEWTPERHWQGYDTAVNFGCQGCHKIQDYGQQVGYDEPPRVGPDLTYIADKIKPEWTPLWIKHPDAYRVDTRMPSFYYFMQKDHKWQFLEGADGKRLKPLPVTDAHLTDPTEGPTNLGEALGVMTTQQDINRFNVEILAMTQYLYNQRDPNTGQVWSRANPEDPNFDPLYAVEPPPGDLDRGRQLVNEVGCTACHIVPEIEAPGGGFVPDVYAEDEGGEVTSPYGMARFDFDQLEMRGPRLTSLGSKIHSRKWMNAWLANPRHYTGHTRMPNMRLEPQERADIVDYLLSFDDKEFDAMETPVFKPGYSEIVRDMYQEFFSKDPSGQIKDPHAVAGEVGDLSNQNRLATVLAMVGERLMMRAGCFGCHSAAGHEDDQPIGTELTKEGIKNIHMLDFGRVPKYVKVDGEKKDLVPHTRQDFFRNKITYPRIWDYSKQLRWTDRLRMPRFNFRMDDDLKQPRLDIPLSEFDPDNEDHYEVRSTRGAVTGVVLGLVEEPIFHDALFDPDEYQKDIIAGRRVIKRYGCNNCHTIEGKQGLLWGFKANVLGADKGTLPPNLFTQGWRTRDEWLMKFMKEPYFLRPIVNVHMPNFELSDEEALAIVNYFKRLAGRDRGMGTYNPDSRLEVEYDRPIEIETEGGKLTVTSALDEAKALFDVINCNKCHLPPDHPLAGNDGGVAPSFEWTPARLRHQWVRMLLYNPGHLIQGTKMPQAWPSQRKGGYDVPAAYRDFAFDLRNDPEWQAAMASADKATRAAALSRLAELQMDMITDYVIHHYEDPEAPAGSPPEEGK